jgi:hypothetical protein
MGGHGFQLSLTGEIIGARVIYVLLCILSWLVWRYSHQRTIAAACVEAARSARSIQKPTTPYQGAGAVV